MKYFDNKGNLKNNVEFGKDSYGEEIITAEREAEKLVESGKVAANSDAAKIYYARKYSETTEGNYGIRTMYNRAWS